MLKLLSEFLINPADFFQDGRRQRIVVISLFCLLFVYILFSMARGAARRTGSAENSDISPASITPPPTQTKWWIRQPPSEVPANLTLSRQTPIAATELFASPNKCPSYATAFKPGTFGYISLFPPYENIVRSEAGKDYPAVGFIARGDWIKILDEPVCVTDGYVWLNVQSAAGSSKWTAGGYKTSQWVIPCPDPQKKCKKENPTRPIEVTAHPSSNGDSEVNRPSICVSAKLTVGLDAQVSPNDLLVVRSAPFTGSVIGHIAPLTVINIIGGPKCAGGAIWWKVWGPETGWAVENSLRACPKEVDCEPWKDENSPP